MYEMQYKNHKCLDENNCRLKMLWWHSNNPIHTTLGKKRPDASERMKNEGNPVWKGDNVGNTGLHGWVNRNLKKPKLCQICKNESPYDLANVTGIYNREFINWKYLCRRCHMKSDGRINNLKQYQLGGGKNKH